LHLNASPAGIDIAALNAMISPFKFLLSCVVTLSGVQVWAGELTSDHQITNPADANTLDFTDYRQNKFLNKFTGTYVSHDQLGRERISSVWIDEDGLHMWELGGFPVFVWHNFTFTFPLKKHDQLEERRGTGVRRIGGPSKRKKYFVYTEYGVENDNSLFIRKTETDADGLHRSIEECRLTTNGTTLHYLFERKYYKRKYLLFGSWVDDTGREIVRRNSKSLVFSYVKQSAHSLPFEILQEVARKRDARLHAAFGNPSQIVADFDWDGYSSVDEVKDALKNSEPPLRNQDAQVIQFPSKCNQLLDPKAR
jgi:hypothetical protein